MCFPPERIHFPTHTVVEGQVLGRAPAILSVNPGVEVPEIEVDGRSLGKARRRANEHIGKGVASLVAVEAEAAVTTVEGMAYIHLIPVILGAELKRVGADNFCEVIRAPICVVVLRYDRSGAPTSARPLMFIDGQF
jgi:hypothetical protein